MEIKFKRRNRKRGASLVGGIVLVLLGATSLFSTLSSFRLEVGTGDDEFHGRHLLQASDEAAEANCTPRSIEQFPPDFMSLEQRENGGVTFHILVAIYIFCALAIVCDDYFVSSLEYICDAMGLQADVAGATFMAAGSSAPELFTSVIGVFLAKSDVGIGTIVGSAVFNILFIIALCGLGSGMVIYLTWWPMFRDCVYYMLSVIILVIVIYDEKVHWYEGLVMFLMYVLYIVLMYFNPPLGDFFTKKVNSWKETNTVVKRISTYHANLRDADNEPLIATSPDKKKAYSNEEKDVIFNQSDKSYGTQCSDSQRSTISISEKERQSILATKDLIRSQSRRESELEASLHGSIADAKGMVEDDEYQSPLTVPDSCVGKIWWGLMLPVSLVFIITIPDCRRPGCWSKLFIMTFIMSIVWIAGLSYLMVWMVTIAGDTLGIPDTVMGLTILAAGTSVPDALSSLFVARDGYGDMAVANSIGSNVFDILLCLGLPWLLQTTAVDLNSVVHINSASLTFVSITLLATVVFLFVSMLLNGWKLNKKFGVMCLFVYAVVITIACLFEMNVFGNINPPSCPRNPAFYS